MNVALYRQDIYTFIYTKSIAEFRKHGTGCLLNISLSDWEENRNLQIRELESVVDELKSLGFSVDSKVEDLEFIVSMQWKRPTRVEVFEAILMGTQASKRLPTENRVTYFDDLIPVQDLRRFQKKKLAQHKALESFSKELKAAIYRAYKRGETSAYFSGVGFGIDREGEQLLKSELETRGFKVTVSHPGRLSTDSLHISVDWGDEDEPQE